MKTIKVNKPTQSKEITATVDCFGEVVFWGDNQEEWETKWKKEINETQRKITTLFKKYNKEVEKWNKLVTEWESRSFIQKVKDLLNGRRFIEEEPESLALYELKQEYLNFATINFIRQNNFKIRYVTSGMQVFYLKS